MKNTRPFLWAVLICYGMTFPASAFAQKSQAPVYTKEQIQAFIREVYQGQADQLFFGADHHRLDMVTDFLHRIQYLPISNSLQKKIPLLSELEFNNKDNPALTKDVVFDPKTFNPLKYGFTMAARTQLLVRVDHSDYIISIKPVE